MAPQPGAGRAGVPGAQRVAGLWVQLHLRLCQARGAPACGLGRWRFRVGERTHPKIVELSSCPSRR